MDTLNCSSNPLGGINISTNTTLKYLDCRSNQLSNLDLSNNASLSFLNCGYNQLNTLNIATNTLLTHLTCTNNFLSNLDLSNNTALVSLVCFNNQLSSLNLSNNVALNELYCRSNQLSSLDLSTNTALCSLGCNYNQIDSLDLSTNTVLCSLGCNYNQLRTLDLSNNTLLTALECVNNQLISLNISNNPALSYLVCRNNLPLLQICVSDIIAAQAQPYWHKDVTAAYTESCLYSLSVEGTIALDGNNNCQADSLEQGMSNLLLSFDNGVKTTYSLTNALGYYQAYLDTGTYTVTVASNVPYTMPCPNSQQVAIDSNYQIQMIDFVLQPTTLCPYLTVDISTPLLRRCFNSTYYINYCNNGTLATNNAYVDVELDSNLYFNGSSIPLTSQTGNVYRFNIGNLPIDSCGIFSIDATVSCASQLGQFHCASAQIYPDSLCSTSLPNIHIADSCLIDSVLFAVTNHADVVHLPYLLLEDTIVVDTGSFTLNMGQSSSLSYPTGGGSSTYQLVLANGNPIHYAASTLVGCHPNSASLTLLHSPNLPQDFADIDCTANRGSFDPNDKTGYPRGYGNDHYIHPNTTIDYRIRFQNTGTDTAIFIKVLDIISSDLDLSTLTLGASSHPYSLTILPGSVLQFKFNSIYLPDSNVNELASHGFIQYSIAQKNNLPNGTVINNSASIYFDYNAPIQTNTTVHTICDNCLPNKFISIEQISSPTYSIVVAPNPFSNQTRIILHGYTGFSDDLILEVYDVMGKLQQQVSPTNDEAQFVLQRGNMPTGIYFFRISEKGHLLQSGRLTVHE